MAYGIDAKFGRMIRFDCFENESLNIFKEMCGSVALRTEFILDFSLMHLCD